LPAHNNNSEQDINSGDKSFFDHRKPLTANFIHNMSYMLEDCSKGDLSFCSTLHLSIHSINFYKSLGAVPLDEWTIFRLTGEPLQSLGRA
jgi:hypothetical protein